VNGYRPGEGYSGGLLDSSRLPRSPKPQSPPWLAQVLGVDFVCDVTSASISGYFGFSTNRPEGADKLYCEVLQDLHVLDGLRRLYLDGPSFDSASLASLPRLKFLECLDLTARTGEIDRSALQEVYKIESLRDIALMAYGVDDYTLASICQNSRLRAIRIPCDTDITDKGFEALSELKELETLMIQSCHVTEVGCNKLPGLTMLRDLQIGSPGLNDEAVEAISRIDSLVMLQLYKVNISDEGIAHLGRLRKLRALGICGYGIGFQEPKTLHITGAGLRLFAQQSNVERLYLGRNTLSLEDLQLLPQLLNLKYLGVLSSQLNNDDITSLRRMFPSTSQVDAAW